MGDLDFSELTDDQLVGLIRGALQEAVRRHPGVQAAAQAAVLDEAEKAKIRVEAAGRESAAQRARERERISAEAAARVRVDAAATNAQAEAELERQISELKAREAKIKAEAKAKSDVAASLARDANRRNWLTRASALVGLGPGQIGLVVYNESVYINEGFDRYDRDHLVSFRGLELSTKRSLMGRKPELLSFCAELRASFNDVHIDGSQYFAKTEAAS